MTTPTEAAQVLERAAIFDQRLARPNRGVVEGWAEALTPHQLDVPALLDAVTVWYSTPRDRVIGVGDVITTARAARQHHGQQRAAHEARALPAGQPPRYQAGGLTADGHPIHAAYEIDGAGHQPCRSCNAKPGELCENPGANQPARIPHAARLQDAWIAAGRPKRGAL